ncbi:MAG: pectate lyase [Verrucomicrobiota bacterium]
MHKNSNPLGARSCRQFGVVAGILLTGGLAQAASGLPAFPGAEGFGSTTPGGRGGEVIEVTNLDDSGPGSLREAISAKGPRIVVFRVSGTIPLKSDLTIKNPNITIAGQTAPGDGICLKNYKLMISTKDAVVRYLRIRRGLESGKADDGLGIGDAENVIVDHCSVTWTCDEVVNTWHGAKDITVQWCIFAEGLHHKAHGFAATIGGVNASYHHNLLANCPGRNPSIGGNHVFQTRNMDYRNNVTFNWGGRTVDGKPSSVNVVNNYFKPGANSTEKNFANIDEAKYAEIGTPQWHISGNYMEGNEAISKDNKAGVTGELQNMVSKPVEFAPVKTASAKEVYPLVLDSVGANLPKRDSVDTRIIGEVETGKNTQGKGVVLDPKEVGGWPELASTEAPADSDHDGMPDKWETGKNLNPKDPADSAADFDKDGYTNIEDYLNWLAAGNVLK